MTGITLSELKMWKVPMTAIEIFFWIALIGVILILIPPIRWQMWRQNFDKFMEKHYSGGRAGGQPKTKKPSLVPPGQRPSRFNKDPENFASDNERVKKEKKEQADKERRARRKRNWRLR